jgi:hypothetical protein
MKIEDFLIAIGLFSMIAVVFMAAAGNIVGNYNDAGIVIPVNNNASAAFNQAGEINNLSLTMQEKLSNTPAGPTSAVNAFIYGAWSTIVMSFKSLAMSVTLITNATALFNLPPEITMFLVSAIILTLVVTIAYLVFRMGVVN